MTDYNYGQIDPLLRYQYQQYLPNVFDDSLTMLETIKHLEGYLTAVQDVFNASSTKISTDMQFFSQLITDVRDDVTGFKEQMENEVLPANLTTILNEWLASGKLSDILTSELLNNKANTADLTALNADYQAHKLAVNTALPLKALASDLSALETEINDKIEAISTTVLNYLTDAEKLDIALTTPLLDHSASIQAYVNAVALGSDYELEFPSGTYRFKNVNLGNKEWTIKGTMATNGYLQDTRFKVIADTNAVAFTGQNKMIHFEGIRVESTGNKADGLNVGFFKNTMTDGTFVSFKNMNISKLSGIVFDITDIIDSQFIGLKIDSCNNVFKFRLDVWTRGTTVLFDQLYVTNCTNVFDCDHTTESKIDNSIFEFNGMGHINYGTWTLDNLYLEYNTSNLVATDTRIMWGAVFDLTELDEVLVTQNGLAYFDRGQSRVTWNKVFGTRLEYDYRAVSMALEANYSTGIWWEIGEWVCNKIGGQMHINFAGSEGYSQQVAGNGLLAGCSETDLYVMQCNNANPDLPNCTAYKTKKGLNSAVDEIKVISTNSERTMFKVFVKTKPYAPRIGIDVNVSFGYFIKGVVENVAQPVSANSWVVDVPTLV